MISGLLGGLGVPTTGLIGQIGNGLSNNSNMLLGLATGGGQGAIQGARMDALNALQQREQEDKQKKIAASMEWAKTHKVDPNFAAAYPDQIAAIAAKQWMPKELSFEERLFNSLPPEQRNSAALAKFGLGGDKPTDDIREYKYDMAQRAQANQPVVPFGDWLAAKRQPQNIINNIPAKAEAADEVERAKENVKFLAGLSAESGKVAQKAADLDFLGRVVSKTNTGQGADFRATLDGIGAALNMSPGTLKTQKDAIDAVVQRIAPTLRQPGSGSQSDAELAGFLRSLPQVAATPGGNQLILSTLRRASQIERERTRIATQYMAKKLTATEAREKLAALDEQSIYASEEEKTLIDNLMGGAPLSGGNEKTKKGWKILGWE